MNISFNIVAIAFAAFVSFPEAGFAADAAPVAPSTPNAFTGNVTLASEYLYRGIAQTNGKAALQGGFDYAHTSGAYVGVWGSSISWLGDIGPGISAPLELDVYGGYKSSFAGGDWSYDVGVLTYNYPGTYPSGFTKADTTEIYGAIGWKFVSIKYSSVVSNHIFGFATPTGGKTRGSAYTDLTLNHDFGNGWGVSAHAGHQTIKDFGDASYTDYRLGVTKDLGFGSVGLSLASTNAKGGAGQPYRNTFNRDLGDERIVVSFTKTL